MHSDEEARLSELSRKWSAPLSTETSARLLGFARRMAEWNVHINLTGAKSAAEIVGDHLVDSFAMARAVPSGATVVDVGSGGGLPALPFAILRQDARLTMVEPRAKRVAFLRAASREFCGRNTEVLRARSEALGTAAFDVAASRATFSPERWLELGLRLVRPGGMVLVFCGEAWVPEDSRFRAQNPIEYETSCGSRRWLGPFCST